MRARTARPVGAGLADGAPAVRSSRACGGPGTSWSLGGNGASVRTRRGPRLSPPVRTGRGVTRPGPRGLRGIRNAIDFTAKSLLQDPAPSPHGRVRRKGTESTLGTGGRVARFGRSDRIAHCRGAWTGRLRRIACRGRSRKILANVHRSVVGYFPKPAPRAAGCSTRKRPRFSRGSGHLSCATECLRIGGCASRHRLLRLAVLALLAVRPAGAVEAGRARRRLRQRLLHELPRRREPERPARPDRPGVRPERSRQPGRLDQGA